MKERFIYYFVKDLLMGEKDLQYGLISIALSVFFLIASLDMLHMPMFSLGFSGLVAYILVGIGAYLVAKSSK